MKQNTCFPGPLELKKYEGLSQDDVMVDRDEKNEKTFGGQSNIHSAYLDIWNLENSAIMSSYLTVGLVGFAANPIMYYLTKELNASPAQMSAMGSIYALPWSLKIFFGMMSDGCPVMGYRRKQYIIFGWLMFCVFNLCLSGLGRPSIDMIILFGSLSSCSLLVADVSNDALCVERSQYEPEKQKGSLQSCGYTARGLGAMCGAIAGALVYNKDSWGWGLTVSQIYFIEACIPLVFVLPFTWPLIEIASGNVPESFYEQLIGIWDTIQSVSVVRPMTFLFLYAILQVPNAAIGNFLLLGLHFSSFFMGLIGICDRSILRTNGLVNIITRD